MIDFPVKMTRGRDGLAVFTVPGPDLIRDKLVPLNSEGVTQIAARFGVSPARASLSRWRVDGYPVDRNGPRVRLPFTVRLKKVYTSPQALARWFKVIQAIGEQVREAGGVTQWQQQGEVAQWQKLQSQASTTASTR